MKDSIRTNSRCLAAGFIVLVSMAVASCDSAEKYSVPKTEQPKDMTFRLELDPADHAWTQKMTAAYDSALQRATKGDTNGAVAAMDSLLSTASVALDTLEYMNPLNPFLLAYVSKGYGQLVDWESARGDTSATRVVAERFQALAQRLQKRKDSVDASR